MKKVLNVGGNSRKIGIPEFYNGWECQLLDIDPDLEPDICCDARDLLSYQSDIYDSVYCSHNLEHYYRHEAKRVLAGFRKILKPDGFTFIRVPDIHAVIKEILAKNIDIEDTLYESAVGPITAIDVIYGYQKEIQESGNDYFAHKNGFTQKSLKKLLEESGFQAVYVCKGPLEVWAYAFQSIPSKEYRNLLGLPD